MYMYVGMGLGQGRKRGGEKRRGEGKRDQRMRDLLMAGKTTLRLWLFRLSTLTRRGNGA